MPDVPSWLHAVREYAATAWVIACVTASTVPCDDVVGDDALVDDVLVDDVLAAEADVPAAVCPDPVAAPDIKLSGAAP